MEAMEQLVELESATPGLDDLRKLALDLAEMLSKPERGLWTWQMGVAFKIAKIAQYSGDGAMIDAANAVLDRMPLKSD